MSNKYSALRGYGQVQRETASDKHIELQLFTKITARLRAESFEDRHLTPILAEVLLDNVKLWNILFCDLVSPNNQLPLDLKSSLISLSKFTSAHTQRVLRGEAGPAVLIEINESIILGMKAFLKGPQPETETQSDLIEKEIA